jgi:SNF2 family DNA or RNA helicase
VYNLLQNVILADEMGLGKTIQTIVFLNSLLDDNHSRGMSKPQPPPLVEPLPLSIPFTVQSTSILVVPPD